MDLKGILGPWAQEDQLDLRDLQGCLATFQQQEHQGLKESRELMESLGDRGSLGLKAKRYDLVPVKKVTRAWHIFILKWYCDENHIFPIEPTLKHKQVACMTRKMLFSIFKYLFSFQRYLSF